MGPYRGDTFAAESMSGAKEHDPSVWAIRCPRCEERIAWPTSIQRHESREEYNKRIEEDYRRQGRTFTPRSEAAWVRMGGEPTSRWPRNGVVARIAAWLLRFT